MDNIRSAGASFPKLTSAALSFSTRKASASVVKLRRSMSSMSMDIVHRSLLAKHAFAKYCSIPRSSRSSGRSRSSIISPSSIIGCCGASATTSIGFSWLSNSLVGRLGVGLCCHTRWRIRLHRTARSTCCWHTHRSTIVIRHRHTGCR